MLSFVRIIRTAFALLLGVTRWLDLAIFYNENLLVILKMLPKLVQNYAKILNLP